VKNAMLKIWGRRSSFNVQKVLWLVGELGLAYEHITAGGGFGRLDEPAFLALNPHGRVPVLQDGDVVVWESHTILRYLAARYSGGGFWLDDPADRSRVEGWMDWSQTSLQPDFLNGVFWATTAHQKPNATGRPSTEASPAVPSTFGCSTGSLRPGRF
jgi:glutathione S-transferase